ncbi:hypothetical protein M514_19811 [Trichuris suis]|uniref:Mos1 transposase HTH domain-containing protein n=1 Tax=Trichuris suis TaxID=68888 RepID=A0A085NEN8_9BILA|nr:hypothetical protein M514_19811 [Trichuris suis]
MAFVEYVSVFVVAADTITKRIRTSRSSIVPSEVAHVNVHGIIAKDEQSALYLSVLARAAVQTSSIVQDTKAKWLQTFLSYLWVLDRSIREAVRNINAAFGPGSVSKSTAGYWFRRFASGCESLEGPPRTGRPSRFDNQALKELVESDPTQTQDEMALKLGVS